jgi:hypothetical protein
MCRVKEAVIIARVARHNQQSVHMRRYFYTPWPYPGSSGA